MDTPTPGQEQNPHPLNRNVHPHLSKAALLMAVVVGIGAILLTVSSLQQQQDNRSRASEKDVISQQEHVKVEKFVKNEAKGLIWDDLREPLDENSPCKSKDKDKKKDLLEVIDKKTGQVIQCTHGPDPAPPGVDVRQAVEPVRTGEEDRTAQEATPGSTLTAASGGSVPCEGDGVSGKRIQAIYARASDKPDRFAQYASSFQTWATNTNNIFVESGLQTGSARSVRWVHDANCNVIIDQVVLAPTEDDTFSNMSVALMSKGYNRVDRKYQVWVDATGPGSYCGIAGIRSDDTPGATNANNNGPSFARTDAGCWGRSNSTEAHEIMHNLGGVQATAPNTNGLFHCNDDYDRMCYLEGGNVMTYTCADTLERLFDCNDDDYFNTNPPAGSYLATRWNTANSLFLFAGGSVAPTPTPSPTLTLVPTAAPGTPAPTNAPTPTPTGPDAIVPQVTITQPLSGARIGNSTKIVVSATDNVGVTRYEIWIDGVRKSQTNTYNWNSKKASPGAHTITAKAFDAAGNVGQASVGVTK